MIQFYKLFKFLNNTFKEITPIFDKDIPINYHLTFLYILH